ncbi:amyloid beta A4 precursor protein-binding family B member 1-interacting protein-like [Hibiscus syriacus]|uniref:Amyloid beta A4 protein-binding family B member 1-interacting protein-like n=1 Tax=Hibiscus syriacus TaxID=106335 RepID=A0A6A3DBD9_HIBSY|nr:amyloid beta A4 precursor protein-binding family B member 1-interacting protein-like [Hibiscus syriacus]
MASPLNDSNLVNVKPEPDVFDNRIEHCPTQQLAIDISSDSSSSSSDDSAYIDDSLLSFLQSNVGSRKRNPDEEPDGSCSTYKKPKTEDSDLALPTTFLVPLPLEDRIQPFSVHVPETGLLVTETVGVQGVVESRQQTKVSRSCKQFWKAGDYEGGNECDSTMSRTVGMDHVRVHPKFLHSNATSHKWALGAFAELLDNALDEACNGATYVCIDVLQNQKDDSKMLLVEDNGGGMSPDKMRQCMSLGYSSKSKMANTIGQYGNGFKTSTMRLGADVIVFSQSPGTYGKSPTRSIGVLSYTFLTETGKEDIVVPISWTKMTRSFEDDWNINLETIIRWSPYASETDLLEQFNFLKDHHGTRIIIYNLWEDDEGKPELDFETDGHDIQIRGVNRDEKSIEMAKTFHNSRHFLTYRHSLRSYASILYLRLPTDFQMVLRGKDIEHHNIVDDMMLTTKIVYRPQIVPGKAPTSSDMVATVTIGFVKDARYHIDIQGFNVYHKNRLIKPFWRVWNAAGSSGRGVLGVLEANFVEPAHDKQGFERTIVLSRLEAKLVGIQKDYWFKNCHEVGYAARRPVKSSLKEDASPVSCVREKSSSQPARNELCSTSEVQNIQSSVKEKTSVPNQNGRVTPTSMEKFSSQPNENDQVSVRSTRTQFGKKVEQIPPVDEVNQDGKSVRASSSNGESRQPPAANTTPRLSHLREKYRVDGDKNLSNNCDMLRLNKLEAENHDLKERLNKMNGELQFEKDRCKSLELQVKQEQQRGQELDKEQIVLIDMIVEERSRRDEEEERLRKKLKDASVTIDELLERVKRFETSGVVATFKTQH